MNRVNDSIKLPNPIYYQAKRSNYNRMTNFKVKLSLIRILIGLFFLASFSSCKNDEKRTNRENGLDIIPTPDRVLMRSGQIDLNNNFWVIADVSDSSMAELGKYLVKEIDNLPGALASIADLYSTRDHQQSITLEIIEDPNIHTQGYNLSITSKNIKIEAVTPQGIFYGIQSILSIIRNNWHEESRTVSLRKTVIKDKPRYNYRVIDLSGNQDTLNMLSMNSLLSSLKINGVITSSNNSILNDLNILRDHYVTTSNSEEFGRGYQEINLDNNQWQGDLLITESLPNSDTIIFKTSSRNQDSLLKKIQIASQIGWSNLAEVQ